MPIVQGAAEGPKREQIRRQAIVLVHGMGEQIPMETVRDFATAVWASDRDLHSSDEKKAGQLFSVPDSTTGSRELRRISTRKSRRRHSDVNDDNDEYAVRNEFFELYWADSTTDTTWADFLGWYVRLVVRRPSEAPKAVRWIWGLLWVVNVAFLLSAQIALLWFVTTEIDQLFIDAIEKARGAQQSLDWGATYRLAFQTPTVVSTCDLVWAPGLVALIGALVYKFSRFKKPSYWLAVTAGFIALWSLVVLIGVLAKPFVFQTSREHNIFWPGFIALVGAALLLIQGFLIKFFGDVEKIVVGTCQRLVLAHFFDGERRTDARDDIFALRIDQIFAEQARRAGRRVASKCNARRAGFAEIAENHRLHIGSSAKVVRNAFGFAVGHGTLRVPRSEHGENRQAQLLPRIVREFETVRRIDRQRLLDHVAHLIDRQLVIVLYRGRSTGVGHDLFEWFVGNAEGNMTKHVQQPAEGVEHETLSGHLPEPFD